MKKQITGFLIVCLLSVIIGVITAQPRNDNPQNQSTIMLQGCLDTNANPNDIEAFVDEHSVYIYFHRNFGNVSITLYNPLNSIISSEVVNTAVQQLVVIPITSQAEGIYTIVLENASGYAEGDFEK